MQPEGNALEARVQRMFLAQGVFAERFLVPAVEETHRMVATDIDVLASEYTSGFHLTRRHAECKSGKRVANLDRVLWLRGVRTMLGADATYFVVDSFDEQGADFARSLDVDVMTIKQLGTWESALSIPEDQWPSRSDFRLIDPIRKRLNERGRRRDAASGDVLIRQALQFVEIDSWLTFGYGRLNRLLRILKNLSDEFPGTGRLNASGNYARYSASALLVRLSQYLMAMCHDVSRVPVSNYHSYLTSRLTFGDQDPSHARGLVQGTVDWMSQVLRDSGTPVPLVFGSNQLFEPPNYSDGLVSLIQELLRAPDEARYLPVAMETEQFGKGDETREFPRLRFAWRNGFRLLNLVKGFTIASVGVNSSLLTPLRGASVGPEKSHRVSQS